MTTHYLVSDTSATGWEQTIYAFLAEKERRSGSRRTVETYSRMLYQFFGTLGKAPDQVAAHQPINILTISANKRERDRSTDRRRGPCRRAPGRNRRKPVRGVHPALARVRARR